MLGRGTGSRRMKAKLCKTGSQLQLDHSMLHSLSLSYTMRLARTHAHSHKLLLSIPFLKTDFSFIQHFLSFIVNILTLIQPLFTP